ncbi:MAG: response regulator [Planctomycetes bacterium]|nr:response regulator [Planctomycetota bacterium]
MSDISKKILIVDDEPNIPSALKRQFGKRFEINTATSGEEGLEKISSSGPFAVVISDLRMPGISGIDFLSEVHNLSPDTVSIILTGFADIDVAVGAVNEGSVFRFLTKPCPHEIMESTLKESLEHYSRLLRMTSYTCKVSVENEKPVMRKCSRGCMAVTGYAAYEFVNDNDLFFKIIMPEHRPMVRREVERVIEGAEVSPIEYKIKKRDSSVRWVRWTMIPRHDDYGKVCRFGGMIEDITESKEIGEDLRMSEARYQRMVANVPGMVFQFVLQTEGTFVFPFVSDRCETMFKVRSDQVIADANVLMDLVRSEEKADLMHSIAVSAENLTPFDWWGTIDVDGTAKLIEVISRPERMLNGDTLWDGIMLDMTDVRKAEVELRLLAKFPGENPNPVMRISLGGKIVYANQASELLLEIWGKAVDQNVPGNILGPIKSVHETGGSDCIEVDCMGKVYSTVFASVADSDYVNLYARDITEVKKAENELKKTNEMLREHDRLKSEFVSTVSHELRTPLCIFKNIVSNAMAGVMGKVSHKLYESLKMADKSIDRLSRIVADFLDISKIESGAMKLNLAVMPIQNVVSDVVESLQLLASAKGITLKSVMESKDLLVNLDSDRITQVLTNLVGNAIKFIPVNGNIKIHVSDHGDEVEMAVQDDGPGLSKDEMEKIFDRFVQVHDLKGEGEHGTGLGLTIAKELVGLHQGRIWVESTLGQGCCFHVMLPKYGTAESDKVESTAGSLEEAE